MSSKEKNTLSSQKDRHAQIHLNSDTSLRCFMGINITPTLRPHTTFLFDKHAVRYKLLDPTNPGKPRVLTMLGRHAALDGEVCALSTCHHSNKILAKFASAEVAIQLFPDQTGGSGLIRTEDKACDSDSVTPLLAVADPSLIASVDVQKEDKTWIQDWASLIMSSDADGQPKGIIIMANEPTEQIPVAITGGNTAPFGFQIYLGSAVTSNGGYLEGELSMSEDGFQGKMYLQSVNPKYDPNVQGSLKFNYVEVAARAKWRDGDLQEAYELELRQKLGTEPAAIDLNHPEALWRLLATETEPSVGELIGMTPPDNDDLHKAVNNGMMNCALLAVNPDWLTDLQLSTPQPLPELVAIATDPINQEFFQKYFKAMGSSELAVVQMNEGWKSFADGWQTVQSRMHYYWQGGASGCLATDKDFLRITEEIAQIYFVKTMRTFQRYVDLPQEERTKWASDLLAAVTTPHMLMRLTSSKECEAIHKYIIMLRALDKAGKFDKLFTKRINGAIQTQVAMRMGTADFQSVEEFLKRVLLHLLNPESTLKGTLFDKLREDLDDLKENDPTKWIGLTNAAKDLAVELTNLALTYKNVPWQQRLKVWKTRILQRYGGDERMVKVYSEVGSLALTALTVGFATFSLVGQLKEWSNLSDIQKATAVLSAIQQVGTLGDQVAKFIKFIREPTEPVSTEMDLFSWSGEWDVLPEDALGSDAYELRLARNAENVLKYDIAVFAGPLEALTVVVTVLSMVSLGFQINSDIENNEPTAVIVFDVLEEVAMFASILVLPAMAANPVLGAVVAVVGIIIGFIDSLIPRNPPVIIVWAETVGTPFVLTVPDPPTGWEQKTENLNLRVLVRNQYPAANQHLPHAVRRIIPSQIFAANLPKTIHPNASIVNLLSKWDDLPEDQQKVVAESIWKSIQSITTVADSTIADCIIAQVATSKSAGPVFFYETNPTNVVNGKDYTDLFTDIGIWVMGYAISSNQYFKNVDGTTCKKNLIPTFQNKELGTNLFLDHLYVTGGFASFLSYAKPQTKIAVLNLILAPDFVPEAFWQHAENLLPCQILLLVAKDLGCDLTEVRQRVTHWGINLSVFDMADGVYNFFQNFLSVPDASFFAYIDSNQNIQSGLPSNRPKPAGVNLCNVQVEIWGQVYQTGGGWGVYDFYQYYNGLYGKTVDDWVMATANLPHSSPSTNIRQLGSSFLGSSSGETGYPVGSPVDPTQIHQPTCFPGDGKVILSTNQQVPISSLRHGDRVLTLTKQGKYQFTEIFFFGHRDYSAVSAFKRIRMEDGNSLRLSAGHYLPVSDTTSWSDTRFMRGKDVLVGQLVWIISEGSNNKEPRPSRVISVEDCICTGLFNPYTLDNSTIIVDNVVASTHSEWFLDSMAPTPLIKYLPRIYDVCLIPGKLIYRIMGPKWAENLQEEVQIDEAAYGETGFKALVKPYLILAKVIIYGMMKHFWQRLSMLIGSTLKNFSS